MMVSASLTLRGAPSRTKSFCISMMSSAVLALVNTVLGVEANQEKRVRYDRGTMPLRRLACSELPGDKELHQSNAISPSRQDIRVDGGLLFAKSESSTLNVPGSPKPPKVSYIDGFSHRIRESEKLSSGNGHPY
jgi:hypothetical protein